jgi:hypothetical protein
MFFRLILNIARRICDAHVFGLKSQGLTCRAGMLIKVVVVDRREKKECMKTNTTHLQTVLVNSSARWADVALQPLVFLSVRQV